MVVTARPRNKTQLLRYLRPGMEFDLVHSRTKTRYGVTVDRVAYGPLLRRVNKVQTNAVNFTGPGYEGRPGYSGEEYTPEHPVWLRWTKFDVWEFTDGFWAVVSDLDGGPGELITVRLEYRYR